MGDEAVLRHSGAPESSHAGQWRVRLGAIIWFSLAVGFLLSAPIIVGWAAWALAGVLAVAAILAVPTAWIRPLVFQRDRARSFVARWLRSCIAWLFILSILVAAPIYYFASITELRPALIPQVTLSNGRKVVVFQGMQHIASENFYKAVIYEVEKALADGYILYYEGVQSESPEARAFFGKLTAALTGGGEDLSGAYKAMGEACGLKFQSDYFTLLEADKKEHPERHVIADVDAIEMKGEYERLMRSDPAFAKAHADDFKTSKSGPGSLGGLVDAIEWLQSGSESQKRLAGVVCRGFMTRTLGWTNEETLPGPFDPIILDFRNRALAKRIVEDPHDRIFITYGTKHLFGVTELLRQNDPKWKVESVKWLRTIESPKRLDGKLDLGGGN